MIQFSGHKFSNAKSTQKMISFHNALYVLLLPIVWEHSSAFYFKNGAVENGTIFGLGIFKHEIDKKNDFIS